LQIFQKIFQKILWLKHEESHNICFENNQDVNPGLLEKIKSSAYDFLMIFKDSSENVQGSFVLAHVFPHESSKTICDN
jgi:hypothetical protein